MYNDKLENKANEIRRAVSEKLHKEFEENYNSYLLYRSNVSDYIEDTVTECLDIILKDEKVIARLVKEATKKVMKEHKDREAAEKNRERMNKELYRITKGNIPCILGCGYTDKKTKEEVMEGFNTFICKECSAKLEAEGKSAHDAFGDKSVYKLFGIEGAADRKRVMR